MSEVPLYAQGRVRHNVADDKSTLYSHARQTMLTNLIPSSHWHRGMIAALLRLLHPLSSILESQPDSERIGFDDKLRKLTTNRQRFWINTTFDHSDACRECLLVELRPEKLRHIVEYFGRTM